MRRYIGAEAAQFALSSSTRFGPGFYKPTIRVKAIIKLKTCTPYWEISRTIDFTLSEREGGRERKEKGRDTETALVENHAKDEKKKKKVRYVEQAGCRGLIFACGKVHSHNTRRTATERGLPFSVASRSDVRCEGFQTILRLVPRCKGQSRVRVRPRTVHRRPGVNPIKLKLTQIHKFF